MSHDFLVATRTRPAADAIEVFGRSAGLELRITGPWRPSGSVLATKVDGKFERTIDVDAPVRVEPDDLPDDLAAVVTKPAWLVEVHLPGGYEAVSDRWALDLAIHVARVGDGAVFDPQADRIVWPSGVTPRVRGAVEERIRTVELAWITAASQLPDDGATRWLDVVAAHLPAATPVRFGSFEPLQGRLDRDGPRAFAEAWETEASVERGGMLFWSAKPPGIDGSVSFPDRRRERRPARLGRVIRVSTTVDARPLHRDPQSCAAVVDLFAAMAEEFGAAYAVGSVLRDAILRRGRIAYDARSEVIPLPRSRWWVGLPALPTWLAWFGSPYRALIGSRLDGSTSMTVARSSGLLLQCGPEPMDMDQLRGVFPALPVELLARRRPGSTVDPTARITMLQGPPSEAAETIPWLD